MSGKAKLTTAILAFCLVLFFLVVGVFATKTASVDLGGTVQFIAKQIYCEVEGEYTGTTPSKQPEKLFWDAENEPKESELASWNGTSLAFDEQGTNIVLTVNIKNLSEEVGINVTLSLGEFDNIDSSKFVRLITYSDKDETDVTYDTSTTTVKYIDKGDTATFSIIYFVPSDEVSISNTNYQYIFTLESDKI